MSRRIGEICGLMLLFLAVGTSALADDVIRIRADAWCPVNCEPGASRPGYMIEIARLIAEEADRRLDYRLLPWPRALAAVREGRADCVVGAYPGDAPDFRYAATPWGYDQTAVYAAADAPWEYESLADLRGQRLGVVGGYAYGGDLNAFMREHPEHFDSYNANNALRSHLRKLLAGRLTGVIESAAVMGYTLAEMGLEGKVTRIGRIGDPNPLHIACSPTQDGAGLPALFEAGFRRLREEGRVAEIRDRYGLPALREALPSRPGLPVVPQPPDQKPDGSR